MIHTQPINKTRIAIISSYVLVIIIILLVIFTIAKNLIVANSADEKKVQVHTTQLDVSEFRRIFTKIQNP